MVRSARAKAFYAVRNDRPEAAAAAGAYSLILSSEERAPRLVGLLAQASPATFWAILAAEWPSFDATWGVADLYMLLMRRHAAAAPRNLPGNGDEFKVYRGGTAARALGLAWTLDIATARGFAHGHRSIRVPDPIIATATVSREDAYLFLDDREEQEVVLDPSRLRGLRIEPYEAADAAG